MKKHSLRILRLSFLLYLFWLLLPAVQTSLHAVFGCATVVLFGVGALMDTDFLRTHWKRTVLRGVCMAALPLLLRVFLDRGGSHFLGYYAQQTMFWFPLVYFGYASDRGDETLWRGVGVMMLACFTVTVLTTIGWLIQGMLRGGRVYAYSRSLGYGVEEGREAYLKELMLRNIGGYDFVYACALSLPMVWAAARHSFGGMKTYFAVLFVLQTVLIALSQYSYALLFAGVVWVIEGIAWLIRRLSKVRSDGASLLMACVPLVLGLLLLVPITRLAISLCNSIGFDHFADSLRQLLSLLTGSGAEDASRFAYYRIAARGFATSPVFGHFPLGERMLSYHSEVLDALSAGGIVLPVVLAICIYLTGRASLKGLKQSPARAHICFSFALLIACALLGTVFYSRDIPAVCVTFAACASHVPPKIFTKKSA